MATIESIATVIKTGVNVVDVARHERNTSVTTKVAETRTMLMARATRLGIEVKSKMNMAAIRAAIAELEFTVPQTYADAKRALVNGTKKEQAMAEKCLAAMEITGTYDPAFADLKAYDGAQEAQVKETAEIEALGFIVETEIGAKQARVFHREARGLSVGNTKHVSTYQLGGSVFGAKGENLPFRSGEEVCGAGVLEALGLDNTQVTKIIFFEETGRNQAPFNQRQQYGIAEIPDLGRVPAEYMDTEWYRELRVITGRRGSAPGGQDWEKRRDIGRLRTRVWAEQRGMWLVGAPNPKASVYSGGSRLRIAKLEVTAMNSNVMAKAVGGEEGGNIHYLTGLLTNLRTENEEQGPVAVWRKVQSCTFGVANDPKASELHTLQAMHALRHAQGLEKELYDAQGDIFASPCDGASPMFTYGAQTGYDIEGQVRMFMLQDKEARQATEDNGFRQLTTEKEEGFSRAGRPVKATGVDLVAYGKGVVISESADALQWVVDNVESSHPGAAVAQILLDMAIKAHNEGQAGVMLVVPNRQIKAGPASVVSGVSNEQGVFSTELVVCATPLSCREYPVDAGAQSVRFLPDASAPAQRDFKIARMVELAHEVETNPSGLLKGIGAELKGLLDASLGLSAALGLTPERAQVILGNLVEKASEVDALSEAFLSNLIRKTSGDIEQEMRGGESEGKLVMPPAVRSRLSAWVGSMAAQILGHFMKERFYIHIEGPNDPRSLVATWLYYGAISTEENGAGRATGCPGKLRTSMVVHTPAMLSAKKNADSDGDLTGGSATTMRLRLPSGKLLKHNLKVVYAGARYPHVNIRYGYVLAADQETPFDGRTEKESKHFNEWIDKVQLVELVLPAGVSENRLLKMSNEQLQEFVMDNLILVKAGGQSLLDDGGVKGQVKKIKVSGPPSAQIAASVAFAKCDLNQTGVLDRTLHQLLEREKFALRKAKKLEAAGATWQAQTWLDLAKTMRRRMITAAVGMEAQVSAYKYTGTKTNYQVDAHLGSGDPDQDAAQDIWSPDQYGLSVFKVYNKVRHILQRHSKTFDISLEALVEDTDSAEMRHLRGRDTEVAVARAVVADAGVILVDTFNNFRVETRTFGLDVGERIRELMREEGVKEDAYYSELDNEQYAEAMSLMSEWDMDWAEILLVSRDLIDSALEGEEDEAREAAAKATTRATRALGARISALGKRISDKALMKVVHDRWTRESKNGSGVPEMRLAEGRLTMLWPRYDLNDQAVTVKLPVVGNDSLTGVVVAAWDNGDRIKEGHLDGLVVGDPVPGVVVYDENGSDAWITRTDRPVRMQVRISGDKANAHAINRPRQAYMLSGGRVIISWGTDKD